MRYLRFIILITTLLSLSNCEKDAEVHPKEYPYVITNSPSVYSEGAEFSADLISIGNQKILKYGFVWGTESNPTIQDSKRLFDEKASKGVYSCNVNSGLAKGQTYYVRAYILTDQYEVYGNVKSFSSQGSLPPVINDFEPKFGPIGTEVVIAGRNFGSSKNSNTVKFGSIKAIIVSASENSIVVIITQLTKPEKVQITIETAGMSVTSRYSFDLWFPWLRKKDFGLVGDNSASFSIENIGYVINRNSTNMLTYNPITDEWQNSITLPENSGNTPLAFSLNEVAYILLNNDMWQYNPLSNNWIKKEVFPGTIQNDRRYIFGFNINSNIYIGNCYNKYEFWEYDTNLDKWIRKSDFIGHFSQSRPVWGNYTFSSNNKGFLGVSQTAFASNTLWKYDPTEDTWSSKSPLPSDAYGDYCSFVINDDTFVGLGNNFVWGDGYVSNKIWKYDFQNDRWIEYHNCPANLGVNTSFCINKKAYIVSGYTKYYYDSDNVWEFDPSKN
jgi:hypothetical protein